MYFPSLRRRLMTLGAVPLLAAVLLAILGSQTIVRADVTAVTQTVLIPAAAESTVDINYPSTNYGSDLLRVSSSERAYIYFDLSVIPAEATISNASFNLNVVDIAGNITPTIAIHKIDDPWDEATVTANSGVGSTALPFNMGMPPTASGVQIWAITQLVEQWHQGNQPNYGLAVVGPQAAYAVYASSRETGMAPYLEVNYEVAEDNTPRPDVGDAPDSSNHVGLNNTAYAGVNGRFPTVFDDVVRGPRHANQTREAVLGNGMSRELEADQGPDQDGVNNILQGGADNADHDRQDDGWRNRNAPFTNCVETTLAVMVSKAAAATKDEMYLNVWFDGNRDGDWADTGSCPASAEGPAQPSYEWLVQNYVVDMTAIPAGGSLIIPVTTKLVLNNTPNGTHWMRFTLSDAPAPTRPNGLGDGRGPAAGYAFGETEDILQKPQVVGQPGVLVLEKSVTTVDDPSPFKEPVEYTIRLRHEGGSEPAATQLADALGPYARLVGQPLVTEISPGVTPLRAKVRFVELPEYDVFQQVVRWRGMLAPGAEMEIKFRVVYGVWCDGEQTSKVIENVVTAQQTDGQPLTASTSFAAACPAYNLDDIAVTQEVVERPTAADSTRVAHLPEMAGQGLFVNRFFVRTTVTNNSLSPLVLGFEATLGVEDEEPEFKCPPWCCLTCTLVADTVYVDTVAPLGATEVLTHEWLPPLTSTLKLRLQPLETKTFMQRVDSSSLSLPGLSSWYGPPVVGWTGCLTCTVTADERPLDTAESQAAIPNTTVIYQQSYCILQDGQNSCPTPIEAPEQVAQLEPLTVELCRCDLGDAPSSMNHAGSPMLAYPGVQANFPTVFDAAVSTPNGPRHNHPGALHLGQRVSLEAEADGGPDQDPQNNINPAAGVPNRDRADDGIRAHQLSFSNCQRHSFNTSVFIDPQAQARILERAPQAVVYLNVWVDGNRDGDWADTAACAPVDGLPSTAVEHIVIDWPVAVASLSAGVNIVPVVSGRVLWPAAMANKPAWLRITLSERPSNKTLQSDGVIYGDGRGYDGEPFSVGETEDYLLRPAEGAGADLALTQQATVERIERDSNGTVDFKFNYRVDYLNEGTETAHNVVLKGMIPERLQGLELTAIHYPSQHEVQGITANIDIWEWRLRDLEPAEGGTIILSWTAGSPTFPATLASRMSGYEHEVTVSSDNDINGGNDSSTAAGQPELPAPVIVTPQNGAIVQESVLVSGRAYPKATVYVELAYGSVETNTTAVQADGATGLWSIEIPQQVIDDILNSDWQRLHLTAVSSLNGGAELRSEPVFVHVSEEGTGELLGLHLAAGDQTSNIELYPAATDQNGEVNQNDWQVNLSGDAKYTVGATVSCADPNASVVLDVEAAGQFPLAALRHQNGQTIFGAVILPDSAKWEDSVPSLLVVCDDIETIYTGNIVVVWDPEGYVFDITNGQTVSGAIVSCLQGVPDGADGFDSFFQWPAAQFGQVNPQTTAADGYFSFFTPAGTFKIEVQKAGYQPYQTKSLLVVDELIRRDVALTPQISDAADHTVLITENGFEPAVINAQAGEVIEWINADGLEHSATGGIFDSGMLGMGASYKFRVPAAGLFGYGDLGNTLNGAHVIVEDGHTVYFPAIVRP